MFHLLKYYCFYVTGNKQKGGKNVLGGLLEIGCYTGAVERDAPT